MSLMTAGKRITTSQVEISIGGNQAFGRGWFIGDPDEAERKARKQLQYQDELKQQMEEAKKRKQAQKRKEQEEDMKLERKFYEDLQKEQQKQPHEKGGQMNQSPLQGQQMSKSQYMKDDPSKSVPSIPPPAMQPTQYPYAFEMRHRTQGDAVTYKPSRFQARPRDMEEQRFYEQSSNNKLKVMRQALEEKLVQVYKRIRGSQDLEVDRELDQIRRKINSYNQGYEQEHPKVKEVDQGFSQFYQIPTHHNISPPAMPLKRTTRQLNNRAHSQYPLQSERKVAMASRGIDSRASEDRGMFGELGDNKEERQWGLRRGKDNFLGNREAVDYKIDSLMGNIDNMLNENSDPY